MKFILVVLTGILFSSCSSLKGELTEKGMLVIEMSRVVHNDCRIVKKIIGEDDSGTIELAVNHAKNLASEIDANFIMINDEIVNGKDVQVHAGAYRCP
ncbi:MAG: hypothetical protein HOJ35_02340 [Bdellovibrionales bacterium]|jgi:hypothetical protein|nr:hypothetical protein [Bdellovibrionales bacterium]